MAHLDLQAPPHQQGFITDGISASNLISSIFPPGTYKTRLSLTNSIFLFHKTHNPNTSSSTVTCKVGAGAQRKQKFSSVVESDGSPALNRVFHLTMGALAVLTPISFVLAPSDLNKPIDLALGFLYPFHSHVALNYVITDYVPKAFRTVARVSLMGVTFATVVGLTQLNMDGIGMTQTVKNLWAGKEAAAAGAGKKGEDAHAAH